MNKETGGPAFPVPVSKDTMGNMVRGSDFTGTDGITMRDYFAAKAMQGYCANQHEQAWSSGPAIIAQWSYEHADAMLAERNKP